MSTFSSNEVFSTGCVDKELKVLLLPIHLIFTGILSDTYKRLRHYRRSTFPDTYVLLLNSD